MKIFLVCLVILFFLILAISTYLYYFYRAKLYVDFCFVSKNLKNNIVFNKDEIGVLLGKYFRSIGKFSRYLLSNKAGIIKNIYHKDINLFVEFLASLGFGDVDYEVNNINYYEAKFIELKDIAKEEVKSKGILYLKLLIGVGLIVGILLI